MGKTSLSAYAAWLAKHETKAPKRRSLDPVPEPEVVHVVNDMSADETSNACHPWIKRKETKLPLMKIVVATPEAIDEIVERGRAAVAMAQANKIGLGKRPDAIMTANKRGFETTTRVEANDAKGKKRGAAESAEAEVRAGKKAKMSTASASMSTTKTSQLAVTARNKETKTSHKPSLALLPTCSSSRNTDLPMLEEVRYWRDVDRFSFLA